MVSGHNLFLFSAWSACGIKDFAAVINPPLATILAVGAELMAAFKVLIENLVMMVVLT